MARASPHAASGPAGAWGGALVCGACLCVPGLGCMSELAHVRMETPLALRVSLPPDLTEAMGAAQLFRSTQDWSFPLPSSLPSLNAPGDWGMPQAELR